MFITNTLITTNCQLYQPEPKVFQFDLLKTHTQVIMYDTTTQNLKMVCAKNIDNSLNIQKYYINKGTK